MMMFVFGVCGDFEKSMEPDADGQESGKDCDFHAATLRFVIKR